MVFLQIYALYLLTFFPFIVLAKTLGVRWTTDWSVCSTNCSLGPDGPWHGAWVKSKGYRVQGFSLYPIASCGTYVLKTSAGGVYNPKNSMVANTTTLETVSDDWQGDDFAPAKLDLDGYIDILTLGGRESEPRLNTTIAAARKWEIELPNDTTYTPEKYSGTFGLGRCGGDNTAPGPLKQLKAQQTITSESFGLHMGSVSQKLPGSLILGGYDRSRVLGDVAVFDMPDGIMPTMFLRDVILGIEEGGSPFNGSSITSSTPMSVWHAPESNSMAAQFNSMLGGAKGAALVLVDAYAPYIYLPPGNCKALASRLPVSWKKEIGYYVWEVGSESYANIVTSPAFVGFVLSDRTAKNITVKIPFSLLNLTLQEPLVDTPTPYFPCRDVGGDVSRWNLGRAFMQGAFLGVNYEQNVTYLAQAPGPDVEQSVATEIGLQRDFSMSSNPAKSFAKTWRAHWTIFDEKEQETNQSQGSGLSGGAIAGIVLGILLFVAIIVICVFFWRRRRRQHQEKQQQEATIKANAATGLHEIAASETRYEMDAPKIPVEVQGSALPHELPGNCLDEQTSSINK